MSNPAFESGTTAMTSAELNDLTSGAPPLAVWKGRYVIGEHVYDLDTTGASMVGLQPFAEPPLFDVYWPDGRHETIGPTVAPHEPGAPE